MLREKPRSTNQPEDIDKTESTTVSGGVRKNEYICVSGLSG